MYPNTFLAFMMSFIPGLGHLYLNRKGRAFLYGAGFFGVLFLAVLGLASHNGEIAFLMLAIAAFIWVINMIDVIAYLMSYNRRQAADPSMYQAPGASGTNHENERFLTILLSFIPGLGHFYLGLMQRGLTFLVAFFGSFALVVFVSFSTHVDGFLTFLLILPVIWIYCMFDAAQLASLKLKGEWIEDRSLFDDFENGRADGRKSRMAATVLSIFPGAGHMYLGLQRRGVQLMAAFLLSIYVLDVMRLSLFLFLIPLIWFFSLFDALQTISRYGREPLVDTPIIGWLVNHQKWVGVGLLSLGVYYLFDQIGLNLLGNWFGDDRVAIWFRQYFKIVVVSCILIIGGMTLLIGSKPSKAGGKTK